MFCVNDTVMYGSQGVYKIVDIRPESFGGDETLYYVLTHIDNDSLVVYCPAESPKVPIRRLLSKQEIYDLIHAMPTAEGEWIEHDQKRNQHFTEILKSGVHTELVSLLKLLYAKKQEKDKENKKMHISDERIMKEAEKLLHEEFAHVLQIKEEEVLPFIMGELDKLKNN